MVKKIWRSGANPLVKFSDITYALYQDKDLHTRKKGSGADFILTTWVKVLRKIKHRFNFHTNMNIAKINTISTLSFLWTVKKWIFRHTVCKNKILPCAKSKKYHSSIWSCKSYIFCISFDGHIPKCSFVEWRRHNQEPIGPNFPSAMR